jgi:hypothetical protein
MTHGAARKAAGRIMTMIHASQQTATGRQMTIIADGAAKSAAGALII